MAALLAAGCSSTDDELLVFAASSLTGAFSDVGDLFEEETGIAVQMNFAGSSALREQILEGAPAGVFAAASVEHVTPVVAAGLATSDPTVFASNNMAIAVPSGNPGGVSGVDAFGDPDLLVGLCAMEVPCGDYARDVLASARVVPSPDTNEPDVRSLVTKLEEAELDVGIVYHTDVANSAEIVEIPLRASDNVVAAYPVVALPAGGTDATAFVAFLGGAEARAVLARHGFVAP